MPKTRLLTASDCARLTGVTVKALRVYERLGLISPARSAKGYRLYGQKELVRLNAIATLKSMGLTLAQVREAFDASAPRLSRVLRMQLDEWRARRAAAEKAIRVVESALVRVGSRETLSIEELGQLVRSIEMTNVPQITRTLLNEMLTPEEERAWSTYYANLPPEEMAGHREHSEGSRAFTQELLRLMNAAADPGSAEVQVLIERSNELSTRTHFREGYLARLRWNEPLTRKLLTLGRRLIVTTAMSGKVATSEASEQFAKFLFDAHRESRAGRALAPLLEEARALRGKGERVDSPAAREVALRLARVCAQYGLGDPTVYANWCVQVGLIRQGREWEELYEVHRDSWQFLADSLESLKTE
jgi:DNA-binding transcriptional MerR regulator